MFMLPARVFLTECEKLAADVFAAAKGAVCAANRDSDFPCLDETAFAATPNISADYAIFKRTSKAAILPVSFEWCVLGAWDAM